MSHTHDILNQMIHHGNAKHPRRAITTKVIKRFFEEAKNEVLEGKVVVLPGEIGEIKVTKRIQDKLPPISRAKLFAEQKKAHAANLSTFGYYFTIDSNSEFMDRYGFKFKASYSFRKVLNKKLNSGFDNYTMTWTQRKSQ